MTAYPTSSDSTTSWGMPSTTSQTTDAIDTFIPILTDIIETTNASSPDSTTDSPLMTTVRTTYDVQVDRTEAWQLDMYQISTSSIRYSNEELLSCYIYIEEMMNCTYDEDIECSNGK